MNHTDDYTHYYTMVMKELIYLSSHKFKNLIKHVFLLLKDNPIDDSIIRYDYDIISVRFDNYFLNDNTELTALLSKDISIGIYTITLMIKNRNIYADKDSYNKLKINEPAFNYLYETQSETERIGVCLDIIHSFKNNYVYDLLTDDFLDKSRAKFRIELERERNLLCNRKRAECMVCFEECHFNMKLKCCPQYLCRLCANKTDQCPNCRVWFN